MKYGSIEYQYAEPIANALADNAAFRTWILSRTEFADYAGSARLLHEETKARRNAISTNWWRSHFTEKCRCPGCSGKETDLLAIFEMNANLRFAVHFEIKQPRDKFKADSVQSSGYPLRAQCWVCNPPASVLPHHKATTALLFSERKRAEYEPHLQHFKTLITFEEVAQQFPNVVLP